MSKTTILNLRVTAEEKAEWQDQADAAGVSLAELVRQRMSNRPPVSPRHERTISAAAPGQVQSAAARTATPVVPCFTSPRHGNKSTK